MRTFLTTATVAVAAFLQGCAGGAITDGSGNLITGNANSDLVVNFQNAGSGATYTTGVDSNGYFGFDGYAPATATNNATFVPEGTYRVWISYKGGAAIQNTPYTIYHQYNDTNCPDHYVSGQQDAKCALYQLELLGGGAVSPPAPHASSFLGFATTVIPLTAGGWCQQVRGGLGVTNMSPRYNDITFQTFSATDVPWGWKVTKGNLDAYGTIPAGSHGGYVDIAENFRGPPYYVYPSTSYTVSFYAGGLDSPCGAVNVTFTTTYDPVPPCVVDHNCPVDPGDGDSGGGDGSCNPGIDCCASGYCSDPDQADPCPAGSNGQCAE